ncbi:MULTISPECIES: DUF3592 domain-containing protein [Streptomyces]|uniref:DUF3592 domain-containing protein n=1 Tax=Streptomyces TaxID=1883 RepID=UPI00163C54B9|nr:MULTISPECIES: DUF3592 domain-containing protein [Streptomyces]MBC2873951.1 DUF3592 domain-containing protein [Streptomyces sp. TYQ1024]UBI39106.1 DUF3592 domain-containing protein [Streptomyces mobaraensis]UKW31685.1 DUF3592 domain-containing protein [Streptomyces sp. TYQ1024]
MTLWAAPLLICACFLAVWFLFYIPWWLACQTVKVYRLRAHGPRVTGTVIRIWTTTDGDGDLQHYPVVSFTLKDPPHTTVETRSATGSPHRCALAPGDETEVIYEPEDPENIIVVQHDWVARPFRYGLATLLIGATCAWMLTPVFKAVYRFGELVLR